MKINRDKLKKLVQEAVKQQMTEDLPGYEHTFVADEEMLEAVATIAVNEGQYYSDYKKGHRNSYEIAQLASTKYLHERMRNLKEDLFDKQQLKAVAEDLEKYWEDK